VCELLGAYQFPSVPIVVSFFELQQKRKTAYLNEVDLGKAVVITRSLNIEDRNDVLVVEVSQQLHLTQSSKTKHGVVERGDFFDGDFLA
jgi:hypothetical protein